jgi:hypothetical protein
MNAHSTPPQANSPHAVQLHIQSFNHLVDLNAISFPPPTPTSTVQWVNLPSFGPRKFTRQTKLEGFLVQVPGYLDPVFVQGKEKADRMYRYLCSHFLAASYLSEFEGDLIDWRHPGGKTLRKGYQLLSHVITKGSELCATLRAIACHRLSRHIYLQTPDGGCLCPSCARHDMASIIHDIRNDGDFKVIGCHIHFEEDMDEGEVTCDECSRIIQPAYGKGAEL